MIVEEESNLKGNDIVWFAVGILLGFLFIRDGINGVKKNRGHRNQISFFLSVGEIVIGIWTLILLIWIKVL